MRRGVISIPAHVRPIRIALHCSKQAGTSHRGMLKSAAANSEAAAGRGGLDGVDEEAGADEDEREQRDAHACESKQGRSALGQLALRRRFSFSARACPRRPQASANPPRGPRWSPGPCFPHGRRADEEGLLLLVARLDLDELLAHGRLDARGVAVEDAVDPPGEG